jgi:two-component system, OmpR family, copper resistance phosphate regulon response regulator CusR
MKLLLVDDDPKLRSILCRGFSESGLECTEADGGSEARAALQTGGPFDLILLDLMMPEESGWTFYDTLRASGDETPVVFLTARHAVEERVRGLRLGAEDYIMKPFEFSELLARIEVVVRRAQREAILRVGNLVIDLQRRFVLRGDLRIEMSPREFDLLLALAKARGKVLSRAELLRDVWGIDFEPGTNVVAVQVSRLRRRIERGGPVMIHTVPGEGYALSAPDGAASAHTEA